RPWKFALGIGKRPAIGNASAGNHHAGRLDWTPRGFIAVVFAVIPGAAGVVAFGQGLGLGFTLALFFSLACRNQCFLASFFGFASLSRQGFFNRFEDFSQI